MEPEVKTKHLLSVTCPECKCLLDIFEEETVHVPFRKKQSDKRIYVKKAVQTKLGK